MDAVNDLVIDAIRNTEPASGRRSSPSRDRPRAADMRQPAVPDHAPGHAGNAGLVPEAGEAGVDGAEGVVERRHRAMMPGRGRRRQAGSVSASRIRLLIRPLDS